MLVSEKDFLDGIQKQRLAETAGTGEEIIGCGIDQFVNKFRFVNVKEISFPQFLKLLYADR
jgi:hypothetical protein